MQSIGQATKSRRISTLAIGGVFIVAGAVIWSWVIRDAPERTQPGKVTVVRGAGQTDSADLAPPPVSFPAPVADSVIQAATPQVVQAAVSRAYPDLEAVRLDCRADRCELSGTPRSPATDADRDRQQAMLFGGLERLLAEQGYPPLGPIQFDEIDDGVFQLRISMPNPMPAG